MKRRTSTLLLSLLLAPALALAENPVVRVATPLGSFDIELCAELSEVCKAAVPNSVDNFLGYVDRGDYVGSLIHRSVPGFVIQGGGFRREGSAIIRAVPPQPAIPNEFHQSNLRGTVAYARTPGIVDSATSQWFINVSDSNSVLDTNNGGFTVFGVVTGEGMEIVDAINGLPRVLIFDEMTSTAPSFLFDLFDPDDIITAFQLVPFAEDFIDRIQVPPPPSLMEVADAFIFTDITRVPEPAAGLGGTTALMALAALSRRSRPA